MSHEHNLAVIDGRLDQTEKNLSKLTENVIAIATNVNLLTTAVKLMEQSQKADAEASRKIPDRLSALEANQNTMRGGWMALCAIGSVVTILSAAVGALAAVLALKH